VARDPGASNASEAAYRTPPGSSALCESEAAATNVLTVRKRSGSNKCFNCAKAKRQQQQSARPKQKSPPRFAQEQYLKEPSQN